MSFSVIIPSRNEDNLRASVTAARKHEPGCAITFINDGIAGMLDLPLDIGIVTGKKPFVFAANCNIGIESSAPRDVVLLNDDALLETPGGFSLLVRTAEEHPEFGIISATTNVVANPNQQPCAIGLREEPLFLAFVCVYIPRRTIEAVGLLDERFQGYGFEDNDYCDRVRAAGLRLGIHDGCYVDHGSLRPTFRSQRGWKTQMMLAEATYHAKRRERVTA